MHRESHHWFSRSLQRDMELIIFGHAGPPVVVFPTSMGAFFEYEDRGMVGALASKLDHGQLRLFCVSSVDGESWYNRRVHPRHRVLRHLYYADYLLNDLVSLVRHLTGWDTVGGAFEIGRFLDGCFDEDWYVLNPPAFLPGMTDPYYLDQYRRNKWVLVTGDADICRGDNEQFSRVLHAKGIPHSLHVWNHSKHDWPDCRPMAQAYLP